MKLHAALPLLMLVSVSHFSRPASACSCMIQFTGPFDVAPGDATTDVPLNARVWVGGGMTMMSPDGQPLVDRALPTRLELMGPATGEVAVNTSVVSGTLRNASLTVLTPVEPLAPEATYGVFVGDELVSTFTTTTSTDAQPPPVPTVELVSSRTSIEYFPGLNCSSCPPSAFATVELSGERLFYVADFVDDQAFEPNEANGEVRVLTSDPVLEFGKGACGGNWDAGPFSSQSFRVGAFDIAGNFSGWSEPRLIVLPGPGCSCGLVPEGSRSTVPGVFALGLLGLSLSRAGLRRGRR